MKTDSFFLVFFFILFACKNNIEDDNSLQALIEDITKKEFEKRSIKLDYLKIDNLSIDKINLGHFYTDRINNLATYLANQKTANESYIKDLTSKGDTAMVNKVQANRLKYLKMASELDSLYNKADTSIKILKAVYLLDAKFQGGRLKDKVTKYLYEKDTTEVVIQVQDPFMHDIVNGNNYLLLLPIIRTRKEN